ncbi:MAG: hypothetical protein JW779_05685 [Candidatus Thorarchaeota archaeon]|nr:hypothetical protein [Candidatus Thorarchaeota archaeon]
MERIIQTIKRESKYPLRVLVTGDYEWLDYTQRIYTISSGVILKAAVIFPT